MVFSLQSFLPSRSQIPQMTLKIEKISDGRKTTIRLSGRLRSEHVDQLKTQIEGDQAGIALDLDGLTLVDVGAVRFLNAWMKTASSCSIVRTIYGGWMIHEKTEED